MNTKQISDLIIEDINTLIAKTKFKPLTEKIRTYIFNRVVASKIEYYSRIYVIPSEVLQTITSRYASMIKSKNKLAKSFPNIGMTHPLLLDLKKLDELQAQSKITAFYQQLNVS